jgi:hypothetical protein
LLGLHEHILQIHVHWLVVLEEVLLCVLHDAVGAKRHQALRIAAEVG